MFLYRKPRPLCNYINPCTTPENKNTCHGVSRGSQHTMARWEPPQPCTSQEKRTRHHHSRKETQSKGRIGALPHTIVCTAPYLPSQGSKEPVSLTSKPSATSSIAHQRHRLSESDLARSQFAKTSTAWFLSSSTAGFRSHPKLSKPLSTT